MAARARFGTWRSPLVASLVASDAVRLSGVVVDGDDVYWVEGRPLEGGRSVLVRRRADGSLGDVTPAGTNVRNRVHEYGGGSHAVHDGVVFYTECADGRIYRLKDGGTPEPITTAGPWRYADLAVAPDGRSLVAVREDHSRRGRVPVNTLVTLDIRDTPRQPTVFASGCDFYATPRFSPDGTELCWLSWRHPQMPWESTELWMAEVSADGVIKPPARLAGAERESVFQPGWSPDGTLHFVTDRTGWWNIYRWRGGPPEVVHAADLEFGRPQWQFGMSTWAFATPETMVVSYAHRGTWRLATLSATDGVLTQVPTPLQPGASIAATSTHAVFVGGTPTEADAVVRVDLKTGVAETLSAAPATTLPPAFISVPQAIEFPTSGGLTAHAFYYEPCNPDVVAFEREKPPLIVIGHGGPTSAASPVLDLRIQYWTTRGFAVADVNYSGSTGFGREYRRRLDGNWGLADVADCVNVAKHLAEGGLVDRERLIIRGGSAGGYTALAALSFHPETFKAAASYYGICDIEVLVRDTHKFESHYLDSLVGPYPTDRGTYRTRSPIHFISRLACPLILFQGLDDLVVPPNQARLMADALRAKGIPVAMLTFEGEQHGFRQAATIVRCLEAELYFYGQVFGFTPADPIEPVEIENQ